MVVLRIVGIVSIPSDPDLNFNLRRILAPRVSGGGSPPRHKLKLLSFALKSCCAVIITR